MTSWSDADVARMLALRGRGLKRGEIAATLGRTEEAITSHLKRIKAGIGRRRVKIDWDADDEAQITAAQRTACGAHLDDLRASAGRW